jgi:hypothetical protein
MTDVLSQEEIDRLLNDVQSPDDDVDVDILKELEGDFLIPTDVTPGQIPSKEPKTKSMFLPSNKNREFPEIPKRTRVIELFGKKYLNTEASNFYSLIEE